MMLKQQTAEIIFCILSNQLGWQIQPIRPDVFDRISNASNI